MANTNLRPGYGIIQETGTTKNNLVPGDGIVQESVAAVGGNVAIKTWNGLAQAQIKTYQGLASASVKTWRGVSNV